MIEKVYETNNSLCPKIAIIMRSKNDMPHVQMALNALKEQSYQNFVLINLDEESTDGTLEVIKKYHSKDLKRVVPISPQETFLNAAVEMIDESIIVLVLAGAIPVNSEWLEKLVRPIINDVADATWSRQVARKNAPFIVAHDARRTFNPKKMQKNRLFFSKVSCSFRKSLWEEVQFYEKGFERDLEWSKVCHQMGARFLYVPDSIIEYSQNYSLAEVYEAKKREGAKECTLFGTKPSIVGQFLSWAKEILRDTGITVLQLRFLDLPYNFLYRTTASFGRYAGQKEVWVKKEKEQKRIFSFSGTYEFDEKVRCDLECIANELWKLSTSSKFCALVLAGSFGRGEGICVVEAGKEIPFNEYNLLLVISDCSCFKKRKIAKQLALLQKNHGALYELSFITKDNLKKIPRTPFFYDLQQGHKVIKGSEDILKGLPQFSKEDLSLEETSFLLLKRVTLFLTSESLEKKELLKVLLKEFQVFCDAALIAAKKYESFYSKKLEKLFQAFSQVTPPDPYFLEKHYAECLQFRMTGDFSSFIGVDPKELFVRSQNYAIQFALWLEAQRLGIESIPDVATYIQVLKKGGNKPYSFTQAIKNIFNNIHIFGFCSLSFFSLSTLFIDPRFRLMSCLLLLLQKAPLPKDQQLLAKLLYHRGSESEQKKRYLALFGKISS